MKNRNNAIELYRFVFAVLIAAFHYERYYTVIPEEQILANGFIGVEFFFILSGFLLAKSNDSAYQILPPPLHCKHTAIDSAWSAGRAFVISKVKILLPRYILVISLSFLMAGTIFHEPLLSLVRRIVNLEWNLLFLQHLNFGRATIFINPLWFFSALIICGYFVTVIYVWKRSVSIVLLLPAAILLGYSFFSVHSVSLLQNDMQMGFLLSGSIRAFAGISLGIVAYQAYIALSKMKFTTFKLVIINLIELYSIMRMVMLFFDLPTGYSAYKYLLYFPVIIIIAFLNITVLSKVLNNKLSRYLGKLSPMIFVLHWELMLPFWQFISPNLAPGRKYSVTLFIALVILVSVLLEIILLVIQNLWNQYKCKDEVLT